MKEETESLDRRLVWATMHLAVHDIAKGNGEAIVYLGHGTCIRGKVNIDLTNNQVLHLNVKYPEGQGWAVVPWEAIVALVGVPNAQT